jgi:hypothetical protein
MVHELVHALLRDFSDVATITKDQMSKPAYDMFRRAHLVCEENTTDALAGILAPMLPLPEPKWLKGRQFKKHGSVKSWGPQKKKEPKKQKNKKKEKNDG